MEGIWHILSNSILFGIDLYILKIRIHTHQFPNWFDSQLHHSLKCLCTLQCKYNKFPTPSNFERLTKAQDSFQAASIAAISSYEQSLIHNYATTKDSKIFRYIKEFTKSHVLPPQLHTDSATAVSDFDKAELFNEYFQSVFTHSNFTLPVISDLPIPSNHQDSICITEQEVLDSLSCLDSKKASGIDNIPPIV